MILSGQSIREAGIIDPFSEREKIHNISHGLGFASYDCRVDLKSFEKQVVLHAGVSILVCTVEHFTMPNNLVGLVKDKSSWMRQGLSLTQPIIDPGFKGYLTLRFTNVGKNEIIIPNGCGIMQVVFEKTDKPCNPYDGSYQNHPSGIIGSAFKMKKELLS